MSQRFKRCQRFWLAALKQVSHIAHRMFTKVTITFSPDSMRHLWICIDCIFLNQFNNWRAILIPQKMKKVIRELFGESVCWIKIVNHVWIDLWISWNWFHIINNEILKIQLILNFSWNQFHKIYIFHPYPIQSEQTEICSHYFSFLPFISTSS